ncbi:LSG1 [Acanthosepion pharaonis]|uniref:LSG1 n=1 Tax=Acanthosepion pharaonis TaxID=158019 RepID=A0A812CGZ4_ACAPH|nr:LSG1 [Sepia pharaonis]
MGKKGKGQVLGRSIIKERFAKKRPIIGSKGETFLHTSELEDGYNWGRLNLMSVTEQSNLEDFLATAEMAGTEFTAEKLNVKFIDRNKDSGLPNEQELKRLKEAQERNKTLLRIPRRWRTILFISIIVYGNQWHPLHLYSPPILLTSSIFLSI